MAIPDEYKIEGLVHKADNITAYQAYHPIHGTVAIYTVDDTLSTERGSAVKKRLYQSGIQMRSISQLNLPFVTKVLEVSQNPNEPYIITEYTKYNLQELIDDGVKLKPKRIYHIFLQVLNAIINLSENGWQVDRLSPYQIKLNDIHQGNGSFTIIGSGSFQTTVTQTIPISTQGKITNTVTLKTEKSPDTVIAPTQTLKDSTLEKTQTLKGTTVPGQSSSGIEPTITLPQGNGTLEGEKDVRLIQRNVYLLGEIAYQLLFGRKYHRSDNVAAANIRKLSSKWRTILDKALSPSLNVRYNSYEAMFRDVHKSLTRNKRIAIGVTPLIALALIAGLCFGINKYIEYKETKEIMSSEAGQAIESFLNIIDKTNDDFPELQEPSSSQENDDAILRPFDEITAQQNQIQKPQTKNER